MNIEVNKTETITWDIDGCDAKAVISEISGKGVSIERVTIVSKSAPEHHKFISCVDESFVRDVHKALSDLIAHVDKQRNVGNTNPDKIKCHCESPEERDECWAYCDYTESTEPKQKDDELPFD